VSDAHRVVAAFDAAAALHRDWAAAHAGTLARAAAMIAAALERGGQVLAFGNGGSALDAQHLAGELVGRFVAERRALPAVALTTDGGILTAVANDYGFEAVFARQIEALGRPGDVAVAITTSGRSPNVLRALAAARAGKMTSIALTGRDGGEAGTLADVHLNVPAGSTARVQEVHRTILHVICELVEKGV
jgi:D-sedoheptulose 7-phosphate isomerase